MRGHQTPVIMVTALDSRDDVVAGLKLGADDYIRKPFDIDELLARLEAVIRRSQTHTARSDKQTLSFGSLAFNLDTLEVTSSGENIVLTAKELALLELFIRKPDMLLSRERILSNIWGADCDPLTNVVDVYISKLRKKLSDAGAGVSIETQRGVGYKLVESDTSNV